MARKLILEENGVQVVLGEIIEYFLKVELNEIKVLDCDEFVERSVDRILINAIVQKEKK